MTEPQETIGPVKQPTFWTLAILDEDGVYIGKEIIHDEAVWVRSKYREPVTNAIDLPLRRHRLVKLPSGKARFDPIVHAKDEAEENAAPSVQPPIAALCRAVVALANGREADAKDIGRVAAFLNTYDGKG